MQPLIMQQPQFVQQPRFIQQQPQIIGQPQQVIRQPQPQMIPMQQQPQMIPMQPQPQPQQNIDANKLLQLKQVFSSADTNRNNSLSLQEFMAVAPQLGIPPQGAQQVFTQIDADRSGGISFQEFMTLFQPKPQAAPGRAVQGNMPGIPQDGKFVDAEFPPVDASIFASSDPGADHLQDLMAQIPNGVTWKRASDICQGGKLFDKIHPNDIAQGALGDCWLLAGLAGLAEFEGLIHNLFEESSASPDGRYNVKMYDGNRKQWQTVVIDDFIPINNRDNQPLCAKPQGNEMWVLLLEKAMAKWMGSYVKCTGAYCMVPYMLFTECGETLSFGQKQIGQGMWDTNTYTTFWAHLKDPHNRMSVDGRPGQPQTVGADQLWQLLMEADDKNHIIGCWTTKPPKQAAGRGAAGEAIASDGIVQGHAYSLISCDEHQADGRVWRVCKVRNPWGNQPGGAAEWKGELSDKWPGWAQFPQLSQRLEIGNAQNDGMFWMAFDQFRESFSDVGIAKVTNPVAKQGKVEGRAPLSNPNAKNTKKFQSQNQGAPPYATPMAPYTSSPATYGAPVATYASPVTYASPMTFASPATYAAPTYASPVTYAAPAYAPPVTYASPTLAPTTLTATPMVSSAPIGTVSAIPGRKWLC